MARTHFLYVLANLTIALILRMIKNIILQDYILTLNTRSHNSNSYLKKKNYFHPIGQAADYVRQHFGGWTNNIPTVRLHTNVENFHLDNRYAFISVDSFVEIQLQSFFLIIHFKFRDCIAYELVFCTFCFFGQKFSEETLCFCQFWLSSRWKGGIGFLHF